LGPDPALVAGNDQVLGELWHLESEALDATLQALDAIECFGVDEVDLYVRRIVDCHTLAGQLHRAYTYYLADPSTAASAPVVIAGANGYCHWARREH
jgi:gamma-glutamylcyclotransferase (GGCT)/AIG2-like uncharacterized protein YtfP